MALPILEKTWYTDLNVEERTGGDGQIDRRRMLFNIKDKLCGMPVPWVVAGSSDGETFGFDGPANGGATDRWVDYTDVSFDSASDDPAKTGMGWIVLRQSAINPKFEVLIQCKNANGTGAGMCCVWVSPTQGFGAVNGGTDGSMLNGDPPTATDRIQILGTTDASGTAWLDGTNSSSPAPQDFIFNYWQSSDGECTRIAVLRSSRREYTTTYPSYHCLSIFFERPKNPPGGWNNPALAAWVSINSTGTTPIHRHAIWNSTTNASLLPLYANHPTQGSMKVYQTCEGVGVPASGTAPELVPRRRNYFSEKFELYPMGLFSNPEGRLGERYDIWWATSGLLDGVTFPVIPARTREFRVFDEMVMLWDGSVPLVA